VEDVLEGKTYTQPLQVCDHGLGPPHTISPALLKERIQVR
jgi:hypothetical protein